MNWRDVVLDLAGDLGEQGVAYLTEELEKLENEADTPWKRVALTMIGDLLEEHGVEGLELAKEIMRNLDKEEVPDLKDLSVRTASDVIAKLQLAEAADRKIHQKYVVILTDVLSKLIQGLILSI